MAVHSHLQITQPLVRRAAGFEPLYEVRCQGRQPPPMHRRPLVNCEAVAHKAEAGELCEGLITGERHMDDTWG